MLLALPVLANGTWSPGDKVWGKPADAPWSECMINSVQADAKGAVQYLANCRIRDHGTIVQTKEVFAPDQTRAFSDKVPAEPLAAVASAPNAPKRATGK